MSILKAIEQLGIESKLPPPENSGEKLSGPLGEFNLPSELLEIFQVGDAIKFAGYPGQMIPFQESKTLVRAAFEPSVYESWPFFRVNEFLSDEIAVIVRGPAQGFVMQRKHDGMDKMVAPDISTFFSELSENPPSDDYFDYEDASWIYPRELTNEDSEVVGQLLAAVDQVTDPYEGESLAALTMSTMEDDEFVKRLGKTLFPIANFRAIIWGRLQNIETDDAREATAMYKADYEARARQ